jgi:hypothetical protein
MMPGLCTGVLQQKSHGKAWTWFWRESLDFCNFRISRFIEITIDFNKAASQTASGTEVALLVA